MRPMLVGLVIAGLVPGLSAQVTGKWPPDSLVNTKVIPHDTPVMQVVGTMRNSFSSSDASLKWPKLTFT